LSGIETGYVAGGITTKSKFVVYGDPILRRNARGSIRPCSAGCEMYGEYRGTDKGYRSYILHDVALLITTNDEARMVSYDSTA
jgi:hypothetical protein